MIQKIRNLILVGAMTLAVAAPVTLLGGVASASITNQVCSGSGEASGEPTNNCESGDISRAGGQIGDLAGRIVDIFSLIIGVIAIIFLLYGGLRYITSGGDSGKVGNAKNTLLYAIIGLIIVALAQVIVNFVLGTAGTAGEGITG